MMVDLLTRDEIFEAWWKLYTIISPLADREIVKPVWDAAFDSGLLVGIDTVVQQLELMLF